MAEIAMASSVGQGGANKPADVAIVQDLLNRQRSTMMLIPLDGLITPDLTAAIVKYQREELKSPLPDGRIDVGGQTLSRLVKDATPTTAYQLFGQRRSALGPTGRVGTIEDLYKRQFGTSPPGLGVIVRAIMADGAVTDIRWAAHMMATIRRETGDTFLPIDEYGKGAGRPYGNPAEYVDKLGNKYRHVYYGRGYAQITWLNNYLKMGQELGVEDAFAIDPTKVSDPTTAYRILSYGARNGTFTGVSLSNYINEAKCDYFNARRVINGTDHAGEIATAAEAIEVILRVAAI